MSMIESIAVIGEGSCGKAAAAYLTLQNKHVRLGGRTFFYKDGVSPTVARLIQKLDEERMALQIAPEYQAQPDPATSVQQGYAASTDYYECFKNGPGYSGFRNPNNLDNRYQFRRRRQAGHWPA